jgi:hypothetical protein
VHLGRRHNHHQPRPDHHDDSVGSLTSHSGLDFAIWWGVQSA